MNRKKETRTKHYYTGKRNYHLCPQRIESIYVYHKIQILQKRNIHRGSKELLEIKTMIDEMKKIQTSGWQIKLRNYPRKRQKIIGPLQDIQHLFNKYSRNGELEGKEVIQGNAPLLENVTCWVKRVHYPALWWRHILSKPHHRKISEH